MTQDAGLQFYKKQKCIFVG